MKKLLIVLVSVLATLFVIGFIICGYFGLQNQDSAKKADVGANLKVFESLVNGYKISYPEKLAIAWGENGSRLSEKLRLAEKDKATFDIVATEAQNCKIISECQIVKDLEKEKYTSQNITLDGISGVKLTNLENMEKTVIATMALWKGKIYAINFAPANITSYENSKADYESLLSGFKFLKEEKTSFLETKKVYAAASCDNIDQQYAPGTTLTRESLRTTNDTGQTFRPTQNSVCKLAVELENVDAGQTATIGLYTMGNLQLVQKIQAVSNGWNYFILDSSVSVTPETEYKIMININGSAGVGRNQWQAGEQGKSDGYSRGHAIIAGYDEQDLDFHFKEYYTTSTDGGGDDGGDEPTSEPTSSSSTDPTASKTTSAAPLTSTNPESAKNTPTAYSTKKPFNLNIVRLWLTGLTETYVDLSWDKVTAEDLAGYLIYYGTKSNDYYYTIDNGTANNIRVFNLSPGGSYYFVARSYNKNGDISDPSNEVTANLVRNIITNYWWILMILGGTFLGSIIYLIVLKKKETKIVVH